MKGRPRLTPYTPKGYHKDMRQVAKEKALRRLRIIKGQVKGLENMIAADKYCLDVITQSSAARHALSGIEDLLLENHLQTCAPAQMKGGRGKKAAREILKVYKLSKKI